MFWSGDIKTKGSSKSNLQNPFCPRCPWFHPSSFIFKSKHSRYFIMIPFELLHPLLLNSPYHFYCFSSDKGYKKDMRDLSLPLHHPQANTAVPSGTRQCLSWNISLLLEEMSSGHNFHLNSLIPTLVWREIVI